MKRKALRLPPAGLRGYCSGLRAQNSFLLLGLFLFLLNSVPAVAQDYTVSSYTFAQSSVTYSAISGTEATTTPTDWDNGNATLPLGFDFVFRGATYSNVNLNYNGYITFGATTPSLTNYSPLTSSDGYNGAVSAFGTNLKGSAGITYTTTGSAPNRTFIVQWNNAKRVVSLGVDVLNFQIQLHETTNIIDIIYGTNTATLSSANVQVGLRGVPFSDYNNRTSSSSWATTTAGTFSGASVSTSPIILPVNGLKFSYTPPPACVAPSTPQAVVGSVTSTGATVNITSPATPVTGYVVIRSTSSSLVIPPVDYTEYYPNNTLGGNPILSVGTTTSIEDSGLLPNTKYYYFIYAYSSTTCGGGPLYSPVGIVNTTTCVPAIVAAAASNITGTSATVNWSRITTGNPTYDLEVSTNAAFTTLFGTAHNGHTTNSFNLTGLTEGTTYYFRVRGTTTGACTDNSFSTGSFKAKNSFTPLSINPADFNADVIANGAGLASASTTAPVDDNDYSYVAQDYRNNADVWGNSYGLPANRTITSPDGVQYLLADYSGNNALRLGGNINTGTLHLLTPVKLSGINIAATSGAGASVVNIKILFSDNTTQDLNNVPINDWFDNGNTIVAGIGRVNRNDDIQNANEEPSKIFQIPVAIEPANQGKVVTGVQFEKVSGQIPNIFSLSGRILTNCPAMNWVSHSIISASSAAVFWTLATAGEGSTTVTYKVEVYSDEAYTMPVAGYPVENVTQTAYVLNNLDMDKPYYIRVQANNGNCVSEYVTDVINISYCVPSVFNSANLGITNVIFGDINKTTTEPEAYDNYNNYSSISTTSWAGGTVNFTITASPGDSDYQTKVWVDFNNDTDFDDAGELVSTIDNNTDSPFTVTRSFIVPANVSLGNHRVRIGMARNIFNESGPEPCAAGTGDYQDYTLKIVSADCPVVTATSSVLTSSSIKIDWTLTNAGTGTTPTYVVEVYSDAANTTPVTGSPFSVNEKTLTLTGLPNGTYYYKIKASNGVCNADAVTGSIALMPCIPTNSTTDPLANTTSSIINVTTTGGFVNIANTTEQDSAYTDYSYMAVSQEAGSSFDYSITVKGFTPVTIWVDWNNDLVFNDTNEKIRNVAAPAGTFTGTITIPAGTPIGRYRMRIRSRNGSNMSPCEMITWSEAEDYTIFVTTPPTCFVPQGLALANTGTAGTFSWTAPAQGTTPLGYEYVVSTSVQAPAGSGTATAVLSVPVTLTPNTANYLYVRSSCGDGNYSDWAFTTFFAGYCSPNGTSATNYINSFTTSGAITNITNNASGYSENGYGSFTDKSVSQSNLGRVNFVAAFGEGNATYGFAVWVDWNDDYDFNDAGEQVYKSTEYTNSASGFFGIPSTATLGNHRMRILADYDNAAPDTPCGFRNTIGEAEDYILTVVPVVACPTIQTVNALPTPDGAEVNWVLTPPGDADPLTFTVEVYTDATYTTQVTGSPFTTADMSYTVTGLTAETTYYYQVMASKTGCTSPYLRGSFTTKCAAPPAVPGGSSEQVFSNGETLSGLEVTIAEGAVTNWFTKNEDGSYTSIPATTLLADNTTYYVSQTVNGCESSMLAILVHSTAGTANPVFKNLMVYPNPAISNIIVSNNRIISKIVVTNILGQTIIAKKSDTDKVQVNVEHLPSAAYILQVYSEGQVTTYKFIKQ